MRLEARIRLGEWLKQFRRVGGFVSRTSSLIDAPLSKHKYMFQSQGEDNENMLKICLLSHCRSDILFNALPGMGSANSQPALPKQRRILLGASSLCCQFYDNLTRPYTVYV